MENQQQPSAAKSTMLSSIKPPEDKADVSIQEVLQEIKRETAQPPPPPQTVQQPHPPSLPAQQHHHTTSHPPMSHPSMYAPMYAPVAPPPFVIPMQNTVPSSPPPSSSESALTSVKGALSLHKNNFLLILLYIGFSLLRLGNVVNLQNLSLLQKIPNSIIGIKALLFVLSYNFLKNQWN